MTTSRGVYMYLTDPDKLKEWIDFRDLSYGELGRAVGVSRQFIHQLVSGQRRTCKPRTARSIEKFVLPPVEQRSPSEKPLFVRRASDMNGDNSETVGAR